MNINHNIITCNNKPRTTIQLPYQDGGKFVERRHPVVTVSTTNFGMLGNKTVYGFYTFQTSMPSLKL